MADIITAATSSAEPLDIRLRKIEIFAALIKHGERPSIEPKYLGPYIEARDALEQLRSEDPLRGRYKLPEIDADLTRITTYVHKVEQQTLPARRIA